MIRPPRSDRDPHRRVLVRALAFEETGCYKPTFHYDCPLNQIRSLEGRVAGIVPHPTEGGLAELYAARDHVRQLMPKTSAAPLHEMPNRYSGMKKQRYLQALADYLSWGIDKTHSYLKFFVKCERFDPQAKVDPDPRAIQFRGARFAVAVAQFLHPIESYIYTSSWGSAGVTKSRNIAKGLNSVARAELLAFKLESFIQPVIVSLDASRFDKHVSQELLRIEHSLYLASNPDPFFAQLLSWQLVNTGFSNLGLKYKVRGRRMSGDMNTAVGNCLIMLLMLIAYALSIGLSKWDCLDDGDDCLLIVEKEQLGLILSTVKGKFLSYGMVMKIEHVADSLPEVLFCRSHPVEYMPGRWKFVRDYRDVLSKAATGTKHWDSITYRLRVINAVGLCELILGLGVPVLQSFALMLLRNVPAGAYDLDLAPCGMAARANRDLKMLGLSLKQLKPVPVQWCARESFATAFGLAPEEQIRLERKFADLTFDAKSTAPPVWEHSGFWDWDQTWGEVVTL